MNAHQPENQSPTATAWLRVVAAVAAHPELWRTAVVQVRRLAQPQWWRRWPPLPLPDRAWMRFRLRTAYGDPDHVPDPADVLTWLYWCREWDRQMRSGTQPARRSGTQPARRSGTQPLRYPRQP